MLTVLAVAILCPTDAAAADTAIPDAGIPDAVLAAQTARVETIARIAPSVVCIFAPAGDNGGSGVLINAEGEALTNFHVVAGLGPFVKCGLSDGKLYWAVVKAVDPTGDLALIKLLGRDDFPHATLGDSSQLRPGDPALVLGNPFLLSDDYQPTVTFGVVSGTRRYQYPSGTFLEYTDCIQTDAAINPGNSGGPLFNAAGELVGINGRASFEKRGRVYTGAGYAISINQAKNFLDHLRSGRIADHGVAGLTVKTLVGDGTDSQVVVAAVSPGSEAVRRGIATGDEVIRFGGRPIATANEFQNVLGIYPAGWRVPITVSNDDGRRTVAIRLEPMHTQAELVQQTAGNPFGGPQLPGVPTGADTDDVPEEYRKLHRPAAGFTNVYWNGVERDRLMESVRKWGGRSGDEWNLTGETAGGQPARLAVTLKGIGIKAGPLAATQSPSETATDKPPGTGGLLTAVAHLHALATDPDGYFTDFEFLGSEPLIDPVTAQNAGLARMLIARRGEAVTRFAFDPESLGLIAQETQIDSGTDPVQLTYGPAEEVADGVTLPATWTIRHAGRDLATIRWTGSPGTGPSGAN